MGRKGLCRRTCGVRVSTLASSSTLCVIAMLTGTWASDGFISLRRRLLLCQRFQGGKHDHFKRPSILPPNESHRVDHENGSCAESFSGKVDSVRSRRAASWSRPIRGMVSDRTANGSMPRRLSGFARDDSSRLRFVLPIWSPVVGGTYDVWTFSRTTKSVEKRAAVPSADDPQVILK